VPLEKGRNVRLLLLLLSVLGLEIAVILFLSRIPVGVLSGCMWFLFLLFGG